MIGIHFQAPFRDWPDVVRQMPRYTPILAIDRGDILKEAKGVNPGCLTILRHWYDHSQTYDGAPYATLLDRARNFFASFLDDTFAQQYAASVDVVKTWNETLANSQHPEELQMRVDQERAMCEVFAAEYAPRWPHMRLALASAAVGNDIPLGIAKLAAQYGHFLSYHSYLFMKGGAVQAQDNEFLAYRWQTMDAAYRANGVYVKWVSTEAGPFESAVTGWRSAQCCGENLECYHNVMRDYAKRCQDWNRANGNRFRGAVLFTSYRANDPQWAQFHTGEREWERLLSVTKDYALGELAAQPPPPQPDPDPQPEPEPVPGNFTELVVVAPAGVNIRTQAGDIVGALPKDTRFVGKLIGGYWYLRGRVSANPELVRLAGEVVTPPPPEQPQPAGPLSGVDVSAWQGEIDWRLMRDKGVRVAGIKVTEGAEHVDARWRHNHTWARAYGIKIFPYHFYRNKIDHRLQAANFTSQAKSVSWDYPLAGDFEDNAPQPGLADDVRLFLEAAGAGTVYTSPGWWDSRIGRQDWARDYLLWVAHWEVNEPQLPAGWSDWWGWQHTVTDGAAAWGVQSEHLDLDWFKALPLLTHWPVSSKALSNGGNTWGQPPGHEAVDLAALRGDAVYAAADGIVERVAYQTDGYGRFVIIGHPWGSTLYAHLTNDSVPFVAGMAVDGGQKIGTVGMTGATSGSHCHFEMKVGESRVNPWPDLQAIG